LASSPLSPNSSKYGHAWLRCIGCRARTRLSRPPWPALSSRLTLADGREHFDAVLDTKVCALPHPCVFGPIRQGEKISGFKHRDSPLDAAAPAVGQRVFGRALGQQARHHLEVERIAVGPSDCRLEACASAPPRVHEVGFEYVRSFSASWPMCSWNFRDFCFWTLLQAGSAGAPAAQRRSRRPRRQS